MGTEMIAFIEYDKELYYRDDYDDPPPISPPFSDLSDTYSLTEEAGLFTGSKDYLFFGAIAGIRNESGIPPLFPPRGLPANPSLALQRAIDAEVFESTFGTGWLFLREIHAALHHQNVDRNLLGFETEIHLETMANLERRLGNDRVRFVFTFE
jgi:hypothetical protein